MKNSKCFLIILIVLLSFISGVLAGETASNPNPPNEQTDVAVGAKLNWTAGDKAAEHDVYFGTDYNEVDDANTSSSSVYKGRQPGTEYPPTGLSPGNTYYWRIDEVNDVNIWKGDVWSYTTFDGNVSRADALQSMLQYLDMPNDINTVWIYGSKYTIGADTTFETFETSIESPFYESWYFFVDDHPWADWEHPCRHVFVDVQTGFPTVINWHLPLNPMGIMDLLRGTFDGTTGCFSWTPSTVYGCDSNDRDYAVIISGGYNLYYNWERYWNNSSYIYTTLVHAYKYREDHIYVLMSDGNSPLHDRHLRDDTYDSSPLDLNGNGTNDIDYACTKLNITTVFDELKDKLDADDFLFIYTTNHGGSESGQDVTLYLWGESIKDDEFATEVDKVKAGQMAIHMAQCHSGGFIDDLSHSSRVIATACKHDESGYVTDDKCFSTFPYHWTAAVAGEYPNDVNVNADANSDGFVSMKEAFDYAKTKTEADHSNQHPQYDSQPSNFGNQVTLNGVTGQDLMMQDKPWDTGLEPDPATKDDIMWTSEDIVVRNNEDGNDTHQNPIADTNNYVYVRARNRGCEAVSGKIRVYWAKAATGLKWDSDWTETNDFIDVNSLASGHSMYECVAWTPPSTGHYCLLARFVECIEDPMTHGETDSVNRNTRYNNNIVWKNVSVVDGTSSGGGDDGNDVIVRNTYPEPTLISLVLQARLSEVNDTLLDHDFNVYIDLGQDLFDLWDDNGQQGEGFEITGPNSLMMLSAFTLISNIPVDANQEFTVSIRTDIPIVKPITDANIYYVDLYQFVRCETHCDANCTLIGDLNGDCVIDYEDLSIIADNWLTTGYGLTGDVYEDWQHMVSLKDFASLAENWLGVAIDMIGGNTYEFRFDSIWPPEP